MNVSQEDINIRSKRNKFYFLLNKELSARVAKVSARCPGDLFILKASLLSIPICTKAPEPILPPRGIRIERSTVLHI